MVDPGDVSLAGRPEAIRNANLVADEKTQQPVDPIPEKPKVSWFVNALTNPPTDPMTIRLLKEVENLEFIAGRKAVGSDNYARIVDAFIKRGWTGFEEEFDRIVPRSRPDYIEIKRNLLREPVYSPKAHPPEDFNMERTND